MKAIRYAVSLAAICVLAGCVGYGYPSSGGYYGSGYPGSGYGQGSGYPGYGSGGTIRCESDDRRTFVAVTIDG